MRTSWRLGQLLLKWPGSLQRKHFGLTGVFLAVSKSTGMGFPRDGWRWAWTGFITGTAGRGDGAGLERGARGRVRKVEVKALFAVVLGKFGLVRFEALFAKPETKPFGFFQIF